MAEENVETNSSGRLTKSTTSEPHVSFRIIVAPSTRQKQVSVLILIPRWRFDRYGKSNITRSLIKNLRSVDPEGKFIKITCAVLEEEEKIERIKEVEELKVQLKGYIRGWGKQKQVDEQWLNEDAVKYYNHVVSKTNYDFIIGHAPYFIDGCLNLRECSKERGHTPKLILFVHDLPQVENGETDETLLRKWLSEAHVVFSMEKSTRDQITKQMEVLEQVPQHKTYIPGFPIELFEVKQEERKYESEGEKEIMMITPMKKDEMKGFDFSLAVNAVSSACSESMRTTLTMITENESDKEEWEKEFRKVLKVANEHLTFKCKFIDNKDELKRQLKKSDLFLFPLEPSSSLFGEEALSAIASAVPVLVSSHSGVGSFLLINENDSVVHDLDEQSWAQRIIQKMTDPVKTEAAREHLLLDTTIASSTQNFTTLICDAACADLEIKIETQEYVPHTAIKIGRNIGLKEQSMCDPESYLVAFFEKSLLLRDKLEKGLLEKYLGKSVQEKWQKLFSALEEGERKLLSVRKGSIIFTLFCPTVDSFYQCSEDTWMRKAIEKFDDLLKVLGFNKTSFGDIDVVPQNNDSKDQISALLLTTRWLFDYTGITTVTRSLVNDLRQHDPNGEDIKITCAILEKDGRIEKVQIDDAKVHNVTLKGAVHPMGKKIKIPEIERMNSFSAAFYHNVFNQGSYNFIIGHAPLFSYGAVNLKNVYKDVHKGQNVPKVILVIHELPTTEQGDLKKETVISWVRCTDIVFSVGESAKNELERFLFRRKHELYIPIHIAGDAMGHTMSASGSISNKYCKQITLMVGRKELGYNGIDFKLVRDAVTKAAESIRERQFENKDNGIHLVLIGEDKSDEDHLKTYFSDSQDNESGFKFQFISSPTTKEEKSRITRSSVFLLPLKENSCKFGLEALNAAAAGIPILVSENSGVAELLEEMGESENSVIGRQRHFYLDVKEWKEKIIEKIDNSHKVKRQKERIRQILLTDKNITTTHSNFISTIVSTSGLRNMDKYVEENGFGPKDKEIAQQKVRWKRVVRGVKSALQKRKTSEDAAVNKTGKSQMMDNEYEGSQTGKKELTDERMYKLSKSVTNESDLRKLGLLGLQLKTDEVDVHISNYPKDITTAVYHTLKQWRDSQANLTFAYQTLCDALRKVEMDLKIDDVLK